MSTTTILVDKQPVEMGTALDCAVSQSANEDRDAFAFEINGQNTIACVDALDQAEWGAHHARGRIQAPVRYRVPGQPCEATQGH